MDNLSRRRFLAIAGTATGMAVGGSRGAAAFRTTLKKALITRKIDAAGMAQMKAAGFDGVECGAWDVTPADAAAGRSLAEKVGMRIHSVLRGWVNFNNSKKVSSDIASVETALASAAAYGADAILLVPCRVGTRAIPKPWEFDIAFDAKTGHVSRVVRGDNAPYKEYIEAQNEATDATREALQKLAPIAQKHKVIIAVENVWNNLWVTPPLAANLIRLVGSPWVRFYFDIGNHVKYAPPEEWIKTLGKLIVKCHVKDFKLNPDGRGGKFCTIRDGSVDWPSVRRELDAIGYNGWMTIEGSGGLSVKEKGERLQKIVRGE